MVKTATERRHTKGSTLVLGGLASERVIVIALAQDRRESLGEIASFFFFFLSLDAN